MRKLGYGIAMVVLLLGITAAVGRADQFILTTGEEEAMVDFLSADYGVAPSTVLVYENRLGSLEEVAATLFLSRISGVSPERIVSLRQQSVPFVSIAQRLHVSPSAILVPPIDRGTVVVRRGPPFGRAIGYYTRSRHARTRPVILTNEEFANRVLLLRSSQFFQVPVTTQLRLVEAGTPLPTLIVENMGKVKIKHFKHHKHHKHHHDEDED